MFDDADLREVRLARADCEDAKFVEANLNRATLENTDLSRADFSQAYLYQTKLDGAQINDGTQFCRAGEIGDTSTGNSCRYDSTNLPASASDSIDQDAINQTTDEKKPGHAAPGAPTADLRIWRGKTDFRI